MLRPILPALCLTALALPLAAQEATEIDLETIVVTAPQEMALPGTSQTSVDSEKLHMQYQGAGLAKILSEMAGVTTQGGAEDPALAVNIRGLQDDGRVAVTVDGMRQNFAKSDHGANGSFYLDTEMLRSVAVTRGPGAAGAGAIAGSVAMTTIKADDIIAPDANQGAEVRLRYGNLTAGLTSHVAVATRLGDVSDMLFAVTKSQAGDYKAGGGAVVQADQSTNSALWKIGTELDGGHRFGLTASYLDKQFETGRSLGSPRQNDATTKGLSFDYAYAPGSDFWDLKATIYDTGTHLAQQSLDMAGHAFGLPRSYDTGTRGIRVQNSALVAFGMADHQLVYGVEAFQDRVTTDDPDAEGGSLTPSGERKVWSLFAEDKIALGDFTVTVGLKREGYGLSNKDGSVSGAKTSPRLALDYAFSDAVSVFASAAKGFRPPTLSETLINGLHPAPADFAIKPNPDLRPEQSANYELGVNLALADRFAEGDMLTTRFALFRNDVQDYIGLGWVQAGFDSYYQYQNLSHVRIQGAELELGYDAGRVFGGLTGQVLHGTDRMTGEELARVPPNRVVLTAGLRSADETREGGLRITHVAAKTTDDFGVGSWKTLDLFYTQAVGESGSFGLTLNNILDEDYTQHLNAQPSPGFNAQVSFTLRF